MTRLLTILALLFCLLFTQQQAFAQDKPADQKLIGAQADPGGQGQSNGQGGARLSLNLSGGVSDSENLSSALEILLMMTLLSLAPAIVMTMTCFTRIVIVLSFLKRAMSMQDLPPAMVVTGFSIFMTIFIMKPVITDINENVYKPYVENESYTFLQAADDAGSRLSDFMLRQTRIADLDLIHRLSGEKTKYNPETVPFHIVVPAFILSEIKTAFQMGFVLFLPFVIIDLVIASILVSMGMFTLPPVVVSTPLKLLLFIMVDGWNLVVGSLAESFIPQS